MKQTLCHLVCTAVTFAYGFIGFALLLPALSAAQAAETEMLSNGEMEAPFANGLAQGWVPNCYGSNEVDI
jgi:hypothetical protein